MASVPPTPPDRIEPDEPPGIEPVPDAPAPGAVPETEPPAPDIDDPDRAPDEYPPPADAMPDGAERSGVPAIARGGMA